ncbi:MAG TPA: hypothetical protein OIM59_11220 [Bacteroides mediterraneensis]|uniref:hypothetical protein n=1 Tax=Bacteroides mediterraneensis TaxID=1841856 RepID=UPI002630086E|nr:hypothetical protein [Bacteroides mediterraneensis]HJH65175.1 hypothetical protein [Bacteroides mediterraneensis]
MRKIIEKIYLVNRAWWDSFTSCFIGTLLGIGITFWISGYLEKKSNKEMEHRIQLLSLSNIKQFIASSKTQSKKCLYIDSIFTEVLDYYPDSIEYVPENLVSECYNNLMSFDLYAADESADNMLNSNIEVWNSMENISDISAIGDIFAGKRMINWMSSEMNRIKRQIYRNVTQDDFIWGMDNHTEAVKVLFSRKENLNLMVEYKMYSKSYEVSIDFAEKLLDRFMKNMNISSDDLKLLGNENLAADTAYHEKF